MGSILAKVRSMDPDDVFSYKTIKLVKIRDRRLGLLHYLIQLGIFIYIVVYTIIIQQRYLRTEVPSGAFRATAQEPPVWPEATSLPYCLQSQPSFNNRENYNCAYMLGLDLTYPPAMMDSILVATRIKDTFYAINTTDNCPDNTLSLEARCAPTASSSNATRNYLAAVENFTVFIEHAVFGRTNKITATNKDSDGTLKFRDGSKRKIEFTSDTREGDIISIQTLLEAANVPSLDGPSGLANGVRSLRYDGVLLIMVVDYHNKGSDSSRFEYEYTIYHIPAVNVVAMQPSTAATGGFTQRTWYGVRIILALSGTVGKFDFPTLLTALVNGFVLVKVASTVVDMLLLYVMPDKDLYTKHKFEVTEDFSDVRENQKQNSMKNVKSAGTEDDF